MKKLFVVAVASSVVLTSCVSKKKFTDLENTNKALQQEVVDTKAALQ